MNMTKYIAHKNGAILIKKWYDEEPMFDGNDFEGFRKEIVKGNVESSVATYLRRLRIAKMDAEEHAAKVIRRAWKKYSVKPFKCCGTYYGECSETCYVDDDEFGRGEMGNANGYGPQKWVCKDCDVIDGYSVFVSSDDDHEV